MSEEHEVNYMNCTGVNISEGVLQFTAVREGDAQARNWSINLQHVESYSAIQTGEEQGLVYSVIYTNEEEGEEGEPLN